MTVSRGEYGDIFAIEECANKRQGLGTRHRLGKNTPVRGDFKELINDAPRKAEGLFLCNAICQEF
jgi:hypothetical protein